MSRLRLFWITDARGTRRGCCKPCRAGAARSSIGNRFNKAPIACAYDPLRHWDFAAYPREGLGDPLRALASRYAGMLIELAIPPASTQWELHQVREAKADGVIMLPNANRHRFAKLTLQDAGIPVLELPLDAVDGSGWARVAPLAARRHA
jgi:hypothetical protein